jgi:hypothetical protein
MTVNRLLIIASVVLFVIAAVLAFATQTDLDTILGVGAAGAACYAGAALA